MPVNPCSDNGKPGYKWGDQGKCYTYVANNASSKAEAKKRAIAQGLAIGDIGKGVKMKNNIEKMVEDHLQMKNWHETMAKSAADMMQDHIKAATWHASQADIVKGMMNEVPLDPEKKVTTVPTAGSAPTPTSGTGMSPSSKEVPLDPQTVQKSELLAILHDHEEKFGKFDVEIESIVGFLIND